MLEKQFSTISLNKIEMKMMNKFIEKSYLINTIIYMVHCLLSFTPIEGSPLVSLWHTIFRFEPGPCVG